MDEELTEPVAAPYDAHCAPVKKDIKKFKPGNFLDATEMPYPSKRVGNSRSPRRNTTIKQSPTKIESGIGSPIPKDGGWSPKDDEIKRSELMRISEMSEKYGAKHVK